MPLLRFLLWTLESEKSFVKHRVFKVNNKTIIAMCETSSKFAIQDKIIICSGLILFLLTRQQQQEAWNKQHLVSLNSILFIRQKQPLEVVYGKSCFIKKETSTQEFSSEFWKISKKTYFLERLRTTTCDSRNKRINDKLLKLTLIILDKCWHSVKLLYL